MDLMWLLQPFLEKDGWHYIGGRDPMEQIPMDDPEIFLEMFEKEAIELRKLNKSMIRSRYVNVMSRLPSWNTRFVRCGSTLFLLSSPTSASSFLDFSGNIPGCMSA